MKELALVLQRPKFKTSEDEIHRITRALARSADAVNVKSRFRAVREDPKDVMIIQTAYDGHADMIVTGDRHLLRLENYRGIKIITVERLLNAL